jgi:hypothetical protein
MVVVFLRFKSASEPFEYISPEASGGSEITYIFSNACLIVVILLDNPLAIKLNRRLALVDRKYSKESTYVNNFNNTFTYKYA